MSQPAGQPINKVRFYADQSRQCALEARRRKWMRNDPSADLWAERARASYYMMRVSLEEQAKC